MRAATGASKHFPALLAAALFAGIPTTAIAQESLMDLLAQVRASNPEIMVYRTRLHQAEAKLSQARHSWWEPNVSLYGRSGGYFYQQYTNVIQQNLDARVADKTVGVQASLPIFSGGQTMATISGAESEVKAVHADLMAETESVLAQTARAYADVAMFTARAATVDAWLTDVSALKQRARSMLAEQRATVTNVAMAEEQYAEAQALRTSIESSLRSAEYRLFRLVGRKVEAAALPEALPWRLPTDRDAAIRMVAHRNPGILAAISRQHESEHGVRKVEGALLPQVSVYASYERQFSGARFTNANNYTEQQRLNIGSYGIKLTVPFEPVTGYYGLRQAQLQVAEHMADVDQLQNQMRMETTDMWNRLVAARARARIDRQWLESAKDAFVGAKREFGQGQRTMQEVMLARRHLFTAQTDLLQAEHDRFVAAAALMSYVGGLMPEASLSSPRHGDPGPQRISEEGLHP